MREREAGKTAEPVIFALDIRSKSLIYQGEGFAGCWVPPHPSPRIKSGAGSLPRGGEGENGRRRLWAQKRLVR